jgi:NAD(P)-dependent dehydrogenase (short-subunit alcohol dehydrogenase family)
VSRELLQLGYDVVLTARERAAGEAAARGLGAPDHARSLVLDVSDDASVARFATELAAGPRVDALVNNAGASFDGFDEGVAARTLDTNYRGAVRVTRALLPQLSPSANIVMVSSGMADLSRFSAPLAKRLLAPGLDAEGVEAIAQEFVSAVARDQHVKLGFPQNAYGVSKALLNAFTRALARELGEGGRRVNAVCPGWVRTRMGGGAAPRSLEEGARGITWAATLGAGGPNGGFFRDTRAIPW